MQFLKLSGIIACLFSSLVVVATPVTGAGDEAAALPEARSIVKRSFLSTCNLPYSLSGTTFSMWCRRADQSLVWSSINLDHCLTNSNGALVWQRKYV